MTANNKDFVLRQMRQQIAEQKKELESRAFALSAVHRSFQNLQHLSSQDKKELEILRRQRQNDLMVVAGL